MSSRDGKIGEKIAVTWFTIYQMFGWGLCTVLCTQDFVLKIDADGSTKQNHFFHLDLKANNIFFVVNCFKHILFCIMSVKETKNLSEHNLKLVNVVSIQTVMLRHFFSKGNSFRSQLKNVTS